MNDRFLLDEHLPPWWPRAIILRQPGLTVWRIGDFGAPPLRSPDPLILAWCETHHFMLVTDNRASMPGHLADHVAQGRHAPGIWTIPRLIPLDILADDLALIAGAALPNEYQDQIRFLPL